MVRFYLMFIAWFSRFFKKPKKKPVSVSKPEKVKIKTTGIVSKLKNPGVDIKAATSVVIPPGGSASVPLDLELEFLSDSWSGEHYWFVQVYPGVVVFPPVLESNPASFKYSATIYNFSKMETNVSVGTVIGILCSTSGFPSVKRSGNL